MNLSKTLENLKKNHEEYTKEVELLTAKKQRVETALAEAQANAFRTFEAIRALQGETTLTQLIQQTAAPVVKMEEGAPDIFDDVEKPPDTLPPAEPGMRWAKNETDEWVLLPINAPQALIKFSTFNIPSVGEDEDFDAIESFIDTA